MLRLDEETRRALIRLAEETQVYPEGNFLKVLDAGEDPDFSAYVQRALTRDRTMRQKRLDITKQIQIQNRELTRFNEQITLLNKDLTVALEEQRKAKEQVIAALKILERKNQDLAQFSWMTSHNLRGPLASTLGIINLLRDYMERSDDLKGLYEHLRGSAHKMDEVLQDVAMLLETRDTEPVLNELIRLESLIEPILADMGPEADGIRACLHVDFSSAPDCTGSRNFIISILRNLILNAFQYRSANRETAIKVRSNKEGECIVLEVSDNGDGIAADHLDKIFEPFKKLHEASKGKGLGLYLARSQAESMNGELTVESEVGVGSVFRLRLPLRDGDPLLPGN